MTACWWAPPVTCTPAACTTTCTSIEPARRAPGSSVGAASRHRAPVPLDGRLLRARGRGVVGRVHDRDAARLAGAGASRATCCGSTRPMTRSARRWYESMGIMIVWMTDGTGGRDPFATRSTCHGAAHPRPPAREQQPRRAEGDAPEPARRRRRAPTRLRRHRQLPLRGGRHATGKQPIPTVKAGQSITFTNNDATKAPTASGTRSPRARRRATRRRASRTRSPTADVSSTPGSSVTAGPPTRGPRHVEHAGGLAARHVHLLLPHPPVHARRLPGRARSAGSPAALGAGPTAQDGHTRPDRDLVSGLVSGSEGFRQTRRVDQEDLVVLPEHE